jgi:hypothetical protein
MPDELTEELPTWSMQNRTLVIVREKQRRGCIAPASTELSAPAEGFVEMEKDRSLPSLGGLHKDELVKGRRRKGGCEQHLGQHQATLWPVEPIEVAEHEHELELVIPVASGPAAGRCEQERQPDNYRDKEEDLHGTPVVSLSASAPHTCEI